MSNLEEKNFSMSNLLGGNLLISNVPNDDLKKYNREKK